MKKWVSLLVALGCGGSDGGGSGPQTTSAGAGDQLDQRSEGGANGANGGALGAGMDADGDSSDASREGGGGAVESAGGAGGSSSGASNGGANGGGSNGGGASGRGEVEACPKPSGTDLIATSYVPPSTAEGCTFDLPSAVSATLESEAEFSSHFACPESATSGIDFASQRLRVSVIREAGFVAPALEHVVSAGKVVRVGWSLPVYCGGAFPPTATALTLLPIGTESIEDDVCRTGSCGAGGFPP